MKMYHKFKIWDKENKKMFHEEITDVTFYMFPGADDTEDNNLGSFIVFHKEFDKRHEEKFFEKGSPNQKYIVLPYSGFKDCEGVRIYEGDLLKEGDGLDVYYRVYYCAQLGEWRISGHTYVDGDSGHTWSLSQNLADYSMEVIGHELTPITGPEEEKGNGE